MALCPRGKRMVEDLSSIPFPSHRGAYATGPYAEPMAMEPMAMEAGLKVEVPSMAKSGAPQTICILGLGGCGSKASTKPAPW